ncbi:hypothetical protein [Zobellella sp. An-6]|uniref:hypothetical protein n=1 Tax=Zobellella sp. An-6 TaxID=3400218 RepID=UPI00404344BB
MKANRVFNSQVQQPPGALLYQRPHLASPRHKVRAGAVRGTFESMVELSDHRGLIENCFGLPCPKIFMYGEQNITLTYLRHIEEQGVRLAGVQYTLSWTFAFAEVTTMTLPVSVLFRLSRPG